MTTELSKFLSFVLRHRPTAIGIELDRDGWADTAALIKAANRHGRSLDLAQLQHVVATNDKQRFAFSPDGTSIRANQGHSVRTVELSHEQRLPPDRLFHGTVSRFLPSIRREGLKAGKRHHVHLSSDWQTAFAVGRRRGSPVILLIDAAGIAAEGRAFFLSTNQVWLTQHVAPRFILDWHTAEPG